MAALPRVDELNALPIRSQVAFAARCARRVRHLFKLEGADDPHAQFQVERAIESAEYFAADRTFAEIGDAVNEISRMARRLAERGGDYRKNAAARAAFSAAHAAQAAKFAASELGPVGEHAEAAARSMVEAVSIAEPGRADAAIRASRSEFENLAVLASGRSSGLGDPVDIGENGPLGPLWGQ